MAGQGDTTETLAGNIARRIEMLPLIYQTEVAQIISKVEENVRARYSGNPASDRADQILGVQDRGEWAGKSAMGAPQGPEGLTIENVEEAFAYQPWMPDQIERGQQVREALILGVKAILRNVPRSPARTRALNAIVLARLESNTAITFRGRF